MEMASQSCFCYFTEKKPDSQPGEITVIKACAVKYGSGVSCKLPKNVVT